MSGEITEAWWDALNVEGPDDFWVEEESEEEARERMSPEDAEADRAYAAKLASGEFTDPFASSANDEQTADREWQVMRSLTVVMVEPTGLSTRALTTIQDGIPSFTAARGIAHGALQRWPNATECRLVTEAGRLVETVLREDA